MTVWLVALVCTCSVTTVSGQRLEGERLTNGTGTRDAFRPVVADARHACVKIRVDGQQVALGTIVDAEGWVLTKASEVQGSLRCALADGRTVSGRLVAVDSPHDLALLKIAARDLQPIRWDTKAKPDVGSWVVSAGIDARPVAVGIVSTPMRRIPPQQGILGISIATDSAGPRITQISPNSAADRAGLRVDDLLVRIDETDVLSRSALGNVLRTRHPGDTVSVRVLRNEQPLQMNVTLGRSSNSFFSRGNLQNQIGGLLSDRRDGFASALQHDTVLQREECGGPLLDLSGKGIGLNIARAGRTETYALTAGDIQPVLQRLLKQARAVIAEQRLAPAAPDLPVPPQE